MKLLGWVLIIYDKIINWDLRLWIKLKLYFIKILFGCFLKVTFQFWINNEIWFNWPISLVVSMAMSSSEFDIGKQIQ